MANTIGGIDAGIAGERAVYYEYRLRHASQDVNTQARIAKDGAKNHDFVPYVGSGTDHINDSYKIDAKIDPDLQAHLQACQQMRQAGGR